jgi:hypothetical protein
VRGGDAADGRQQARPGGQKKGEKKKSSFYRPHQVDWWWFRANLSRPRSRMCERARSPPARTPQPPPPPKHFTAHWYGTPPPPRQGRVAQPEKPEGPAQTSGSLVTGPPRRLCDPNFFFFAPRVANVFLRGRRAPLSASPSFPPPPISRRRVAARSRWSGGNTRPRHLVRPPCFRARQLIDSDESLKSETRAPPRDLVPLQLSPRRPRPPPGHPATTGPRPFAPPTRLSDAKLVVMDESRRRRSGCRAPVGAVVCSNPLSGRLSLGQRHRGCVMLISHPHAGTLFSRWRTTRIVGLV